MRKGSNRSRKRTRGDVLRINITPSVRKDGKQEKPWLKIYHHPFGIKYPGKLTSDQAEAKKGISRKKVAQLIGEEIIKSSKILSEWFEGVS